MKIKYILPSIILSASVFVSCGEEKTETTETVPKEEVVEEIVEEEVLIDELDQDYFEESVQSQWDDVVGQIKAGEKANLDMYLDGTADTFSQDEWNALDFSQPEYSETFSQYKTFGELPVASNMPEGTKVVQVNFETQEDGNVFESTVMIYLVLEDGLIWISGCELIG